MGTLQYVHQNAGALKTILGGTSMIPMLRHDPDPVPTNAAEGCRRESYSNLGIYRRCFARIRPHTPPVAYRIPQAKRPQKTLKTEGV